MNRPLHTSFFILLFAVAQQMYGQEYSYARYDTKEGLASSVVYHAVRDHDGFMWFATETGLSRFDGTQFRNFTIADGLPDNEILKLYVDSKNRIWMMPFRNTVCYYFKGKIYTADNDPLLRAITLNSPITAIAEDSSGNLMLLENFGGAYILKPDGSYLSIPRIMGEIFRGHTIGLNRKGNFVIVGGYVGIGFIMVEFINGIPGIVEDLNAFTPNNVNTVVLRPELRIVRQDRRLVITTNDTVRYIQMPDNFVGITMLADSMLAINTTSGSHIYNLHELRVIDTFAKGKHISSVVADHEGNWWFCTLGQGIYRLISPAFQTFTLLDKTKPSGVYSITQYDSVLLLGSDEFRIFSMDRRTQKISKVYDEPDPSRITVILKMDPHNMVIGADNALLHDSYGKKKIIISSLAVKSIYANDGHLLVASHIGVYKMSFPSFKIIDTVWKTRSSWAWEHNNKIYIGTVNGLYERDSAGNTTYLGKISPIFSRRITAMADGKDGILWIGTYGEGVIGMKNGKVATIISTAEGLSSNNCRALFVDGSKLWVGTENGLNRVVIASRPVITKFTTADGLASDIINVIYADKSALYVGTAAGITSFNEEEVSQQSTCRLRITGIAAGNFTVAYDTANFILPSNKRRIRFDFAGISYKSGGDITFHYRLSGLSNEWQTTRSSYLDYPSLPSGAYRFECYAVNKFGIKSNTLSIPFEVEKLLWEKWWFRILAGLALVAVVWLFISIRVRIIRERAQEALKKDKRITELEQMALKAQMNPHFIFNSLNSIQQYIIENDFEGVNNFISGFASLIRQTLEVSSKAKISIEDELKYISTYLQLEKMRTENKFTFQIKVSDDIVPSDYFIPPLILQPCLENSIRHGIRYRKDNNGKIIVNIFKDSTWLYCTVEDNGVGRKKAEEYKGQRHIEYQSKGMKLTISRIEMIGNSHLKPSVSWEDIIDEDGKVSGTRVIIRFPLDSITED